MTFHRACRAVANLKVMRGIALLASCSSLVAATIGFEENRGQAAPEVKFLARHGTAAVLLTTESAVLWLPDGPVEMRCGGGRAAVQPEGEDPLPGVTNYLRGRDPGGWRTGIRSFARVRYRQVYPGVDLVFHAESGELEYDFVLAPGANPAAIRMQFGGAGPVRLDGPDLVLHTPSGEVRHRRPRLYQESGGRRAPVSGDYALEPDGQVRFRVAPYDRSRPLVIDPVLTYHVRLGPRPVDSGQLAGFQRGAAAVAVDAAGNAYLVGSTYTADFPTTSGAFQARFRSRIPTPFRFLNDVFIAKVNPAGTALVYSTFLGGEDNDNGAGLALALDGSVYVTGLTLSNDFPVTPDAFQTTRRAEPETSFVAKLNAAGSVLEYSTYLGGSQARGIAVDASGSAYVTGTVTLPGFPTTPGAFRATFSGFNDAFVTKLRPDGSGVAYSTFLGLAFPEAFFLPALAPNSIAVDSTGAAVVGGSARAGFPVTAGAPQPAFRGMIDGYVAKLRPDGSSLVYSTYLGGTELDGVSSIALDGAGNAYVGGFTNSVDFPTTTGAFQPAATSEPRLFFGRFYPRFGFLTKLDPAGALVYSTYLGGSANIVLSSVAVDAAGNALVPGATDAPDFPTTPDALQPCVGNEFGYANAFLAKFNPGATALLYATYLGGNVRDDGAAVAVDRSGNAYLTGRSDSTDFSATPGALGVPAGQVFLSKIDLAAPSPSPAVTCVSNAASRAAGAVSAGEIVSILGSGLGPDQAVPLRVESGRLTTSLASTRVLFDGVPAPLVMVSAGHVNAVVPYAVANRASTNMQVEAAGRVVASRTVPVRQYSPALFTLNGSGVGGAAALNQNGTVNSPANPADRGSFVSLYVNGLALAMPSRVDGEVATDVGRLFGAIAATIGGRSVPVVYAGTSPGLLAALTQINLFVPRDSASGPAVPVRVTAANTNTQERVTIAVQ
jgi:uncharacterized protein (TIGR03437 family)